jgi:hypothetical protein
VSVIWEKLNDGPKNAGTTMKWVATAAYVVGGALMVWSSYIHFHLWQSGGYRQIATIGPLFLLQSIAGLILGLVVIGVRRVWAAVLGVGFAASTMIGFFISVEHGLFGFKDSASAPFAHLALIVEIATMVVLVIAGALCLIGSARSTNTGITPTPATSVDA